MRILPIPVIGPSAKKLVRAVKKGKGVFYFTPNYSRGNTNHYISTLSASIAGLSKRWNLFHEEQNNINSKNSSAVMGLKEAVGSLNKKIDGIIELKEIVETLNKQVNDVREETRIAITETKNELYTSAHEGNLKIDAIHDDLENKIGLARNEVMLELRYGERKSSEHKESAFAVDQKILNPEKIKMLKENKKLRLNLGAGHVCKPDYINVDVRELPGIDVVANITDLPFDENSLDEVFSSHVLEHFPEEMLKRKLLPYLFKLIKPKGCFRAVVPDGYAMLLAAAKKEIPFSDFREVTFGLQEYDGDFHYTMFSTYSLTALLKNAGFQKIEIIEESRPNGKCLEFEILASKG